MKTLKNIIKSFFYSKEDFQPAYFYVLVLMILVFTMIIMRLCGDGDLSDTIILGVLGFVVSWLAVFNWDRKNKNGFHKCDDKEEVKQENKDTNDIFINNERSHI